MIPLIIATKNKGKVKEFKELLSEYPFKVISLLDVPGCPEIIEDGTTFKENAVKKAETVRDYTKEMVLADDSGLEVDFLGGEPGIYSARFAGDNASDEENNRKLLGLLKGVPEEKRGAQFTCVIAISCPEKGTKVVEGTCRGTIISASLGDMGFGYDPLFLVPGYGKTFSQLEPDIKNKISHRGKAMEKVAELLKGLV